MKLLGVELSGKQGLAGFSEEIVLLALRFVYDVLQRLSGGAFLSRASESLHIALTEELSKLPPGLQADVPAGIAPAHGPRRAAGPGGRVTRRLIVPLAAAALALAARRLRAAARSTRRRPRRPRRLRPRRPSTPTPTRWSSPRARLPRRVRDAPVAVSVIGADEIQKSAMTESYADLLRAVPGINTAQTSARDVNLTPRLATGRNARATLALLDGRTIYQDYFGMVLWDLLPINFDEVKQVEVVRGPDSAMWGANAMGGVVNILTKDPAEMLGVSGKIRGRHARHARGERPLRGPVGRRVVQGQRLVFHAGRVGAADDAPGRHAAAGVREHRHAPVPPRRPPRPRPPRRREVEVRRRLRLQRRRDAHRPRPVRREGPVPGPRRAPSTARRTSTPRRT